MASSYRKRAQDILHAQYKAGYDAGIQATFRTIYPCILIAAHELLGYGNTRSLRLLRKVDEIVTSGMYIDSQEAIEDVLQRYGIRLEFKNGDDPFDNTIVKEA